MVQWNLVIFLIFAFLVTWVHPYPSGAPPRVCQSMTPGHDVEPQATESPFKITARTDGNTVKVTIQDPSSEHQIHGFLLRAFEENDAPIVDGRFSTTSLTKTLDCGFGKEGALTHNSKVEKASILTTWTPPAGFDGKVYFKATVVIFAPVFWMNVKSNVVSAKSNEVGQFVTTTTTTTTTEVPASSVLPSTDVYTGCGITKGCFGLPGDCIDKRTCTVVLTYMSVPELGHVHFQLVGALDSKSGWVAVGISRTSKMGDNSVTECVLVADQVVVRESWNYANPKGNFVLHGHPNITDTKGEISDRIITCSWNRPFSTVAYGFTFELAEENYYLLLAKGPVDASGNKFRHSDTAVSENKVNMTSVALIAGERSTLIKIHGSFMTAAWIGFVSLGILLARHYKLVWTKYKLCGVKVWFAVHRCFMLLSVALIAVAFIVIFVHVDGWSEIGRNPHAILGCIATGFAVLQPFIAVCRPHPTSPKRPIFRWIHGLVGNGGQLIAVVNMFFAVSLRTANLPQAFNWVLATFIIFYCLVHLLIHIHSCFMEREREHESNSKIQQMQMGDGYDINEDAPGSAFKVFTLGLFSMVTIGLTTALVLMICLN